MEKWKKELYDRLVNKKQDVNKIEFLNEYIEDIDGNNRDAKRKRLSRFYENCLNERNGIKKIIREPVYENMHEQNHIKLDVKPNTVITFGLISDTHFNSKYVQLTHLHNFYDICTELNVKNIYHVGDIDDGENMRPGHVYENYTQGATEHVKEIIKNYPYRKGIITHFITGNHDASFRKHCGLDIGQLISSERSDLDYIGRDIATVNITPEVSMQLRHPWSGSAYALSYRPQKIVEAFEANVQHKPNIVCIGHFHKMEYLYYHGVHVLQTGCFQAPTPFTEGKGISTSVGGWIITVELDSNGDILTFTPKAVPYVEFITDDYKNYL